MKNNPEKKCIKKCKLNKDNICIGCNRTIEEIIDAGNRVRKKDIPVSEKNQDSLDLPK